MNTRLELSKDKSLFPSNFEAILILSFHLISITICILGITYFHDVLSVAIFLCFVLGYIFARGLELAHALMHGAFFRKKYINISRFLGMIFTLPFFLSWSHWRWTHFFHHRDSRIEGFNYSDFQSLKDCTSIVKHFLMFNHWCNAIRRPYYSFFYIKSLVYDLEKCVMEKSSPRKNLLNKIRKEYYIIFISWLLLFLFFLSTNVLYIFYALIVLISASISHVLIELPEHVFAEPQKNDAYFSAYEITSSPIADFLTFNNTRHATHHKYPEVPIYKVHKISNISKVKYHYKSKTYSNFIKKFVARFPK